MPLGKSPAAVAEPARFDPEHFESGRVDLGAPAGLPPALAMSRLPAGRHGLPRAFVVHNQRLRIVAGMLRVLPQHGYPATTIGHVTEKAGVSRAAFYQQFAGKEECFLATYDLAGRWFCEGVERAVAGADEWRARVRAGAAEALRLLGANPLVAHLLVVEPMQAGRVARERQQAMLDRFAAALRDGHPGRDGLPEDLADMLLGGVVTLIARYVDTGRTEQLPESTAVLVDYLLIPYLGAEEAEASLGSLRKAG